MRDAEKSICQRGIILKITNSGFDKRLPHFSGIRTWEYKQISLFAPNPANA